jgi:YidC/Oxa1 family membrane protein insertase
MHAMHALLATTPILANIIEEAFSPLISLFESILVFIHDHVVASWGLAIVGLTVVTRGVMMPLTFSQFRSMRNMQLHAPELKKIKEKYKDDKQRQNEETMKYMREMGINPFASCLPLLLQLPVFISLFYMLRTDLKKHICGPELKAHGIVTTKAIEKATCNQVAPHSANFLFVPDVTAKATGLVLVVLISVYIASQLTSTMLMSASAEPSQRWMMLALPVLFVVFLYRYPAGLLVYWITTNLWTLGQGVYVRRNINPTLPATVPATAAARGKPAGKPDGPAPAATESPNGKANGASTKDAGAIGAPPSPALTGAGASAPPPPPRRKKKRSGRRR